MKPNPNNVSKQPAGIPHNLYSPTGLAQFLQKYDLYLSRALGQHFLLNPKILRSMIELAELPKHGHIIEIGPGIGHLTWQLIDHGLSVLAIEKDRTFARILNHLEEERQSLMETKTTTLTVLNQDALDVDFSQLIKDYTVDSVIGNLPYNVSVPILFQLAYTLPRFQKICVMIQKEVGERILAQPGTKSYGRLSIVLKYLYSIRKLRTIPPSAFFPPPKVESIVIDMIPKPQADLEFAQKFLERAVHIGFMHRRKKLRKQFLGSIIEKRELDSSFMEQAENEFNFDQRAEEWDLQTWVRFSEFIHRWKVS